MTTKRPRPAKAKPAPKPAAKMPAIRLRKGGNPNPPPPPVEYRFKPGQSGNPSGRPAILSGAYKAMLAAVDPRDPEGRTNAELIAVAARSQALQGDVGAMREIRSATEGDKLTVEDVSKKNDAELIAELAALMDAARARAGADAGGGTPATRPDSPASADSD